jgi:hypothetical protein
MLCARPDKAVHGGGERAIDNQPHPVANPAGLMHVTNRILRAKKMLTNRSGGR